MCLFVAVAVTSIAIDTLTKVAVVSSLRPGEPVKLLGGAIYFTLTRNSGAAFSMATDFTWALSSLAILVVAGIVWYAATRLGSVLWAVGLGLVAGGALGNLVDRIFRAPGFMTGEVVDFISLFHPYGKGWAIFNLADSSLVIGVAVIILMELTGRRIDGSRVSKDVQGESK